MNLFYDLPCEIQHKILMMNVCKDINKHRLEWKFNEIAFIIHILENHDNGTVYEVGFDDYVEYYFSGCCLEKGYWCYEYRRCFDLNIFQETRIYDFERDCIIKKDISDEFDDKQH